MEYVFDIKNARHYRFPTHVNDLIVDRADAATSEVFMVVLEPGESAPLHIHDDTEQIFYVLEGHGLLTIGTEEETMQAVPGNVVRIPPSTWHRIEAVGGPMRYLAVDCFLGERPSNEPTWDDHVKVNCAREGWNFDSVRQ
jgi:quercetin dioxygenase-like cupin family protein